MANVKFPPPPKPELNETQKDKIRETQSQQFSIMDEDADGKVTMEEVATLKQKLEARKSQGGEMQQFEESLLKKMSSETFAKRSDKNGDGSITLDEYSVFHKPEVQEL